MTSPDDIELHGALWNTDYDGNIADEIADAIDAASDQNRTTWIAENGKRICAIVPVDVAECGEKI